MLTIVGKKMLTKGKPRESGGRKTRGPKFSREDMAARCRLAMILLDRNRKSARNASSGFVVIEAVISTPHCPSGVLSGNMMG